MRQPGSNLPDFRAIQLEFAAHIRNPAVNAAPPDVEERRMKIYRDLFYNNIERFLASAFPIAKKVLGGKRWHSLVREFIHIHPSESPYFLEISQEFLAFLGNREAGPDQPDDQGLPGFLLELCHYEWVELALSISDIELPVDGFDPQGDLLANPVLVSPLIWCLTYRWPVHQIGPANIPDRPPEQHTDLVVCRRRNEEVGFLAVNPATLRLIALLQSGRTGGEALTVLDRELEHVPANVVYEQGLATLNRLRDAEIVLGARI